MVMYSFGLELIFWVFLGNSTENYFLFSSFEYS